MSLSFTFNRESPNGSQFVITGAKTHVIAALMQDGHTQLDAVKLIARAKRESGKVVKSPRLKSRTILADSQIVRQFLDETYVRQTDAMPLFSSVYDNFRVWLERSLRPLWSKKRFSQALPPEHQSIPGPANVRVVRGLTRKRP